MSNQETIALIDGYNGQYKINTQGVVTSVAHTRVTKRGFKKNYKEKTMSPHLNHAGYLQLNLGQRPNPKKHMIHRLVAEAFLPNPNNYTTVNHIDGNKLNNNLDNLEWTSQSMNTQHAFDSGLHSGIGENCNMAKLTEKEVLEIRAKAGKVTQKVLASQYNTSTHNIYKIIYRKTWKHV